MAMLVEVHREVAEAGRRLRLVNVVGSPRLTLEACGLTEHFAVANEPRPS
jgi:anti-anti-sigma regulatory factor